MRACCALCHFSHLGLVYLAGLCNFAMVFAAFVICVFVLCYRSVALCGPAGKGLIVTPVNVPLYVAQQWALFVVRTLAWTCCEKFMAKRCPLMYHYGP